MLSEASFYFPPNLDLKAPITAGITEITMIKIRTTEKLSLIIGILPKKYPRSVQLNTHKTAPTMLYSKK